MPQENEPKEQRIGILSAVLMTVTALLFDGMQIFSTFVLNFVVPGSGFVGAEFVSFISVVAFGIWFGVKGVSYFDRNGAMKVIIMLTSVIVELVPIIDAIPAITFGVVSLILITRAEDGKPGLFGILETVSGNRKAAMNDTQKVAAQKRADARIERDSRSLEAGEVERKRAKKGIEGYSSRIINDYLKEYSPKEEEEERKAA